MEDALDIQTQITAQIARALNFELIQGAAKRVDSSSKTNAAASEDAARGWAILIYRPGLEQLLKAQEFFENAFSKDPGLASSRVGLATVLAIIPFEKTLPEAERAKYLERAEELLRPVLNGSSATADAYFALGRVRRSQFRNDEAIVAFERAVALNPNHPGALRHLGVAQMAVGQPQKAIEAVMRLIEISPGIHCFSRCGERLVSRRYSQDRTKRPCFP